MKNTNNINEAGVACRSLRVLVDCPKCGSLGHDLGGGPHFDGVRTCGNGCGTWETEEEWQAIRNANAKRAPLPTNKL